MKNILIPFLLLPLLWSCGEDVIEYSCDPVLNEIITAHKQEYLKYAVIDIVVEAPDVQQAIFRTYDPVKKRELWLEKLYYLLKNGKYSAEEYDHVLKLTGFLHEHFFEEAYTTAEAGQRKVFVSDWISYAKKSLGWSDRDVAFVIYRLYTTQEQFDAEKTALEMIQQQALSESETFSCNCNQTNSFCSFETEGCTSTGCETTGGCGYFWSETCDGNCS